MKVSVTVTTKMTYTAVIDAPTEHDAVREAMLDALLQDSYDFDSQEADWEVLPDETISTKVRASRLKLIKDAVNDRQAG